MGHVVLWQRVCQGDQGTARRAASTCTLQLVQGQRDERGRVRHRLWQTWVVSDQLKASGQLDALAGSFARLGPAAGRDAPRGRARCWWSRTSVRELDVVALDRSRACPRARRGHSCRSVRSRQALIASRLCSPSPLYDVAGWASGAAVQELLGIPAALLNDDRLGRALETFAVYAETIRGAVAARAIERYGVDVGRLHVDLTTLRVAGAYEDSALVAKGWGRRAHGRAPGAGAAGHARPTASRSTVRPDPGNAAELALVGAGAGTAARARPAPSRPAGLRLGLRAPQDAGPDRRRRAALRRPAAGRQRVPRALHSADSRPPRAASRSTTSRRANAACPPTSAPASRGCAPRVDSSPTPTTGQPTARSGRLRFTPPRRPARSPPPASAPSPRPSTRSRASSAASAAATTRPASTVDDQRRPRSSAHQLAGLLSVTTGTRHGKPTLSFARDQARDRQPPPPPTASTRSPPTSPAALIAPSTPHASTRTNRSSNAATATPSNRSRSARSSSTTTTASTPSSASSASPCSIFGLIEAQARATPRRPPTPRPAPRRPRRHPHRPQPPRRLPRPRPHLHPTTASASTASPAPNVTSSNSSTSSHPGPSKTPNPPQVRKTG